MQTGKDAVVCFRGMFQNIHHGVNLGELWEVFDSWSRFHVKCLRHDTFQLTFYSDRPFSAPQCTVPSPAYPAHRGVYIYGRKLTTVATITECNLHVESNNRMLLLQSNLKLGFFLLA